MSTPAIVASGLTKEYRIGLRVGRQVLAEAITRSVPRLWSRTQRRRGGEWFNALDDVSFEIPQGSATAVVGRNGAGKTTLLKVLSRITRPTAGEVRIRGRVGSLLEVGTGFHPELTGRENVFMNGSILGMRRAEITRKFDEIVAFADIERFIDTPVKRYSSGMYVRLAFSVAAHLEPEILMIDEVLAVGDAQFQSRCLGKMDEVASGGRTVVFVSHNTAAVQQLTSHALLIDGGRLIMHDATDRVVAEYLKSLAGRSGEADLTHARRYDAALGERVRMVRVALEGDKSGAFPADASLRFRVAFEAREHMSTLRFCTWISKIDGTPVGISFGEGFPAPVPGRVVDYIVELSGHRLAPASYWLGLSLGIGNEDVGYTDYDGVDDVISFDVLPREGQGGATSQWLKHWGSVRLPKPTVCRVD